MTNDEKTYVEFYKKYRPNTWDGLVGQQRVANVLQKSVLRNDIPTAYGFFGSSGCGKTSAAFILAKSLNCLNLQENGDPCNSCERCKAIDRGEQIGINYISMANKGSTDEVRKIVEQAWMNQPLKKQVWILDEVHNLHSAAFDSLLVPLESNNIPALFIFCSTEVNKIPKTFLARLRSYTFNKVGSQDLSELLEMISDKEGISVDENLIRESIRKGKGSVRDTVSSFESLAAEEGFNTNEGEETYGERLLNALSGRDLGKAFESIAEAEKNGIESIDLLEQLIEDLRNIYMLTSKVDRKLIDPIPIKVTNDFLKGLVNKKLISHSIRRLGDAYTRASLGSEARIQLEVAIADIINDLEKMSRKANGS